MRGKLLIGLAAILLGVAAAFLGLTYLNTAAGRLTAEQRPIEVLVAAQDIPRGTTAEELVSKKLAVVQKVPARYVADAAVSSARTIEGRVLASPVSKGQQLTNAFFQLPADAGLAYGVPSNYVAIAIPTDEYRSVAGLIKPGDQVAVIGTVQLGQDDKTQTHILVPKARVLAIGKDVGSGEQPKPTGKTQTGLASNQTQQQQNALPKSVTLALSPADAERIVFVEESGKVWLALLPGSATAGATAGGQKVSTVLSTGASAGLR
jgi:pilus assembly protein CpaB